MNSVIQSLVLSTDVPAAPWDHARFFSFMMSITSSMRFATPPSNIPDLFFMTDKKGAPFF